MISPSNLILVPGLPDLVSTHYLVKQRRFLRATVDVIPHPVLGRQSLFAKQGVPRVDEVDV